MESDNGRLSFRVTLNNDQLVADAEKSKNILKGIGDAATAHGARLDVAFKNAGKSAGVFGNDLASLQQNILALASIATLGRIGKEIITIRGEFQQLGIAFETMLGSKEKSDRLMSEQIALAQKSPFTLMEVATNTKQLMAMGIETEKVMETMKSLGDVAAGVSVPISRIAINYGQVATQGKLMGRELRDFNMAGIPLIDELAKNLGKAKDEISGMVEAGKIGFKDVEKAFQTMSGEGGKFYNLMEKQNASVTGQISNLTDKLQVMMNDLGKSNEGLIYGGISGLATLVENYKGIISVLEVLAITYGTVKTAMIAVAAYESVMATIDAARTKIIAGKVAAIQAEFAAMDAATAKAKILAAEETARAAKQLATEQALSTSASKINAAKLANVKATQDLAAAELELQIVQARNTSAYNAGFISLKQSQNVKKEMAAVDKAYSNLKKAEVITDKAITADTVLNERIKAQAVKTGEAEKTAAKVQATAASRALMVANEQATASEIAMAAVNPWMIAAAGIAVLVGALIYFKKEVKTTEELVTDLNKSIDAIGKQIELESAISKYESLKDKVGKTKTEQDELNKAIKTLSAIFPDAIGKTDQYGKAIDLVTESLRKLSAESRQNTKDVAEAAKAEAEAAKQRLVTQRTLLQSEVKTGITVDPVSYGLGGVPIGGGARKLPADEILDRKKQIADINTEIENLGKTISNESAKIYELASAGAEAFIEKNARLFKEVNEFTRDEAFKASAELLSMLGSEGGRADEAIKKQVTALSEYARGIKTTKEQTVALWAELTKANEKLKELQNPSYESKTGTPLKDIEDQKSLIKELEDKLGMHKKEKEAVDELKKAQFALDKAVKSGNQSRIDSAVKVLEKLQQEKDLIDGIAESVLTVARNQALPRKGSTTVAGAIDDMKKATGLDFSDAGKLEPKILAPEWDKLKAKIKSVEDFKEDQDEKTKKRLENEKNLREDILYTATSLISILSQNGMISQESANAINDSMSAILSGDILQMAVQAVSMIASIFPSQAEEFQSRIDKINVALKEQQRLIELARRFGGEEAAREKERNELLKLKKEQEAQLEKAERKRDNKIFKFGPIYKGYVKDVAELTAALAETNNQLDDTEIALQDFLTGGITENTLADAISRGFEEGKTAVDDFSDYMTDVLKNASIEIFKTDLLNSPEMVDYMAYVKEAYRDGAISAEEKAGIDRRAANIAEANKPKWDALTQNIGMDGATRTGSSRGIAQASQDSVDENNGRLTAIQGHTFSMSQGVSILVSNSERALKHLSGIETNTARLESIETSMSKVKEGIDAMNYRMSTTGVVIK